MRFAVNNLSCLRGELRILSGVSFSLNAGQALILQGPNGSGKTTLLRALAGLAPAESGEIDAPEDCLAYSGHADGIKSQLTVVENLRFWADVFGTRDIEPALEVFDLTPLADRQAQYLSAGQKRRLGLSRLLVTGRPLWLLDEPTVSLDAVNVALFAGMIETHLAGGGIAVLATHINLGLTGAATLDMSRFKPDATDYGSPFLAGDFT
jgi:heme exporter protein A